jgi:hypothetical protein
MGEVMDFLQAGASQLQTNKNPLGKRRLNPGGTKRRL